MSPIASVNVQMVTLRLMIHVLLASTLVVANAVALNKANA